MKRNFTVRVAVCLCKLLAWWVHRYLECNNAFICYSTDPCPDDSKWDVIVASPKLARPAWNAMKPSP